MWAGTQFAEAGMALVGSVVVRFGAKLHGSVVVVGYCRQVEPELAALERKSVVRTAPCVWVMPVEVGSIEPGQKATGIVPARFAVDAGQSWHRSGAKTIAAMVCRITVAIVVGSAVRFGTAVEPVAVVVDTRHLLYRPGGCLGPRRRYIELGEWCKSFAVAEMCSMSWKASLLPWSVSAVAADAVAGFLRHSRQVE